jgi:hypothetical protein
VGEVRRVEGRADVSLSDWAAGETFGHQLHPQPHRRARAGARGFGEVALPRRVTRRFPSLNFGFLECGAAWACSLFADLVGHYEKRSLAAMEYVDPAQLDVDKMMQYFDDFADPFTKKHIDAARRLLRPRLPAVAPRKDDFWKTGITDIHEIVDLFANRFYIGAKLMIAQWRGPSTARSILSARDSRDVRIRRRHWDVIDVGDVVVEAQELVDDGLISAQDFKEFMFWNPVELHAGVNPDFFKGTRVETAVDDFLRDGRR